MEKEDILSIAHLAQLEPEEESLDALSQDFNRILDFVTSLQSLDTESVEPLCHVHDQQNVFRDDLCEPSFSTDETFLNAPEAEDGFFVVPLVIETLKK